MDVDSVDQVMIVDDTPQASSSTGRKRQLTLPVDDAHPFDLEAYIATYTGRTVIDRLHHIMHVCPTLATQAVSLAVQHAMSGRDTSLYTAVINSYNQIQGIPEPIVIDQEWVETTAVRNNSERVKLEVELKTYSNNMIKESIRMAHRDLGNFYRTIGDSSAALKHYTKSREFCSTSQHIIEMCFSVLELLVEQRNYSHITTYVFKADAALDAGNPPGGSAKKASPERERAQTQLDLCTALSHLGSSHYDKAAYTFLKLGPPKNLQDWAGMLVSPGDIAIFGSLSALASLSRSAIKTQILESESFGIYLEHEPYVRELIDSYLSSQFKTVLELLDRFSTRHYIDIHLSSHVHDLMHLIRSRTMVLYFKPFASIKLERMGQAFGLPIDELERDVVALIQAGEIHGRVDSQNKVLKAKERDHRAELFGRAIAVGKEMQSTNKKLLLRMRLQQADLVVKAPKRQDSFVEGMVALS